MSAKQLAGYFLMGIPLGALVTLAFDTMGVETFVVLGYLSLIIGCAVIGAWMAEL